MRYSERTRVVARKEITITTDRQAPRGRKTDRRDGYAAPVPPPFASEEVAPPPPPLTSAPAPVGLPQAGWNWHHAALGTLVGFGPTLVLYFVAGDSQSEPVTDVSAATAFALLLNSLMLYAWQAGSAWFFSLRIRGEGLVAWGFRRPTKAFFWTIPLALICVYAIAYFHDVIVHPEQQEILTFFPRTPSGVVLLVLLAVVAAPLFEELFFRGFVFRGLANSWGWPAGAAMTAIVFGAAHLQLSVFLPLFALGFALAWVYQRTGSIWTSIALHAIFNGISVTVWALAG